MKKFRFRLEALLKQREQIEKDRQKEVAEAVRQVNNQKARLDDISARNQGTLQRKRERQIGSLSVSELQLFSRYLHRLKRDTLGAEELLRALRKTESRKREALIEAARSRKIFETLKDRQRDRYYQEADQLAVKESDEIGLNTYRAEHAKAHK